MQVPVAGWTDTGNVVQTSNRILFKSKKILLQNTVWTNFKDMMINEMGRSQRDNSAWFHLFEQQLPNSQTQTAEQCAPGSEERQNGKLLKDRVLVLQNENFWWSVAQQCEQTKHYWAARFTIAKMLYSVLPFWPEFKKESKSRCSESEYKTGFAKVMIRNW